MINPSLLTVRKAALTMVMLNAFTTPLMLSAANVALPRIAIDLNLDAVSLSWIPMAYLMASAVFILIFGKIADNYGRKRIFLAGTFCVIITSVFAACSVNGLMLITARFLQGTSAAMLYATQIAIVSSVSHPEKRGHAIGMTVSTIYLGLCFGPVLGGYFVDLFGWRASFVFYIPLALIVLVIGLIWVPGDWASDKKEPYDYKGSILYAVSIICISYGAANLKNHEGYSTLILGIIGMIMFVIIAKKTKYPVFDVKLFFINRVFRFSSLASYIIYTATYANVVLISLFLQYLKDLSALSAGIIMMTQPLTMAILSPVAGKLSDKLEPRIIASLGMGITGFGLLMLANLNVMSSLTILVILLIITGIGLSLFSSPNSNAIMGAVEKRYYGSASGSLATMRILGQLSSMIIVSLVFGLLMGTVEIMPENYSSLENSIKLSFLLAAILCIPGIVFSLIRGRIHN